MELIKKPEKDILKKSLKNGLGYGDALGGEVVERIKNKTEIKPETEI